MRFILFPLSYIFHWLSNKTCGLLRIESISIESVTSFVAIIFSILVPDGTINYVILGY